MILSLDELVYDRSRFGENSPLCIFIPSKEVMVKIMKACIGLENPEDLWFNQ
jgi:hypothetical protein